MVAIVYYDMLHSWEADIMHSSRKEALFACSINPTMPTYIYISSCYNNNNMIMLMHMYTTLVSIIALVL